MAERPWWALYAMPRCEKELVRRLRALQIGWYCPLVPHRQRSPAGRLRTSYQPLFSGYVFMVGNDQQRYQAMTTNCVWPCMSVPDGVELYRNLSQIWQLNERGLALTIEALLAPGQRVTIRSGRLAGIEGVSVRRQGKTRLIVAVNFRQQDASVLLEDWEVAAV